MADYTFNWFPSAIDADEGVTPTEQTSQEGIMRRNAPSDTKEQSDSPNFLRNALRSMANGFTGGPEEARRVLGAGLDKDKYTLQEEALREYLSSLTPSGDDRLVVDEQGRPAESFRPTARPNSLMTKPNQGPSTGVPSNIDFTFIGGLEGNESSMYIPKKDGKVLDSSGPTVGTGVDLGQRSPEELEGLPQGLRQKLAPYTNMQGEAAMAFIQSNPLTLSDGEVETLNAWAKKQETDRLLKLWERDSDIPWDSLTKQQATAVASLMYQYGSGKVRTPKFWKAATSGDWDSVEAELRNFGDKYSTRRNKEADFLTGQ